MDLLHHRGKSGGVIRIAVVDGRNEMIAQVISAGGKRGGRNRCLAVRVKRDIGGQRRRFGSQPVVSCYQKT